MQPLASRLATKLMLSLAGSMVLLFGLLGYLNLRLQRQHMAEIVFESAGSISDLIWRSIVYSMLRNQREEVSHVINTIRSQPRHQQDPHPQ